MVFGFVLLSTGNPHLYKWEILFSLSWAVCLRFLGKSPLMSKTDQPAAAEQRGDLSCSRAETLQHNSKLFIALVSEEMKAGHQEKLIRENNRAGRAAGAQSTADLFGRTVSSYFGKISFGVAGREALACVISSRVPEFLPFFWAQDVSGKVQTQNPSSQELLFLSPLTLMEQGTSQSFNYDGTSKKQGLILKKIYLSVTWQQALLKVGPILHSPK